MSNTRRVELVTDEGTKDIPFLSLKKGDRFRLYEEDGTPVEGGVINLALGDAYDTNGVYGIQVKEQDTPRTWGDGVKDAARIVQNEMRHKKALHHPPQTSVHPAVFETLNEVKLHLAAMLSRGSYESHDTVMQESLGDVMTSAKGLRIGDPQPIPCPDCGGTGSNTAKYPIVGCSTCEGDGRVAATRWLNNEVQFARLLCEMVAAYDGDMKYFIKEMAHSMDLEPDQVNELFDRAEKVWEKAKAEVIACPPKP